MKHMMRLLRILLPLVVLTAVFTASADAARGPCLSGKKKPTCYHWQAKVTAVHDGDTISVNILRDGKRAIRRVRVTGVNAMEQTVYSHNPDERRGACHAVAATNRLQSLIRAGGNRVRLSAQRPSSRSGKRLRRSVAIKSGGRWVDLGQVLIDEGHVLFHPNGREWAHNARYLKGAQVAARKGLRLYDRDSCGYGPDQGARLKMWVNWDADGTDGRGNPNGEWVKIKNVGSSSLSIGGWWFRDSMIRRFKFPAGARIRAGRAITVYMGSRPSWDRNRSTHFYWGQRSPVFENVKARKGVGDGGYLFDRQGDLRAWMMYPCRLSCRDALKGKVRVSAHPKRPEKVFVKNVSSSKVRLEGYVVDNHPWTYSFKAGTTLHPGDRLRLMVKGSPRRSSGLRHYWGKRTYILNDRGDKVILRTQRNIKIDCHAWGRTRC